MKALAVVCVLAGTAAAERPGFDDDEPVRKPESMLGFGFGGGSLPGRDVDVMGLDVEVEHRLPIGSLESGRWRFAGQYEYLFVGHRTAGNDQMLTDGNAHRITFALRHSIARTRLIGGNFRLFLDGELGAGLLVGNNGATTMIDTAVFAGLRVGYDLTRLRDDTKVSPTWQPAVWFRALSTGRDLPVGWLIGIGLAWGG